MFKSNELKVGFLALMAFLILYFGFNFLKGNDLFSKSNTYYIQYDNVDGLTASNLVMINGVEVGKVRKVFLDPLDGNKIKVEIWVNKGLILPDIRWGITRRESYPLRAVG
jgi:phospholipid/cholesterol/gamma-HCH transport system substrate-binding protein